MIIRASIANLLSIPSVFFICFLSYFCLETFKLLIYTLCKKDGCFMLCLREKQ